MVQKCLLKFKGFFWMQNVIHSKSKEFLENHFDSVNNALSFLPCPSKKLSKITGCVQKRWLKAHFVKFSSLRYKRRQIWVELIIDNIILLQLLCTPFILRLNISFMFVFLLMSQDTQPGCPPPIHLSKIKLGEIKRLRQNRKTWSQSFSNESCERRKAGVFNSLTKNVKLSV